MKSTIKLFPSSLLHKISYRQSIYRIENMSFFPFNQKHYGLSYSCKIKIWLLVVQYMGFPEEIIWNRKSNNMKYFGGFYDSVFEDDV